MTPAQKVGQLILLGLASDRLGPDEIRAIQDEHVGSVWFVDRTDIGVAGVKAVADAVQAQVSSPSTANVRFVIAANQEGGITQALHGPGFSEIPSAAVQGTFPVATLQADAATWGAQLRQAGVNLDFAPVMDVVPPGGDPSNQPIGVLHRAFGHDPATVGAHGTAFLQGLQQSGVTGTLKHFPGLGRVQGNTDFTASVVDRVTTPSDPYLQPFAQGIAAGADLVMVALATYTQIDPDHLAAFSPTVMQLLRQRLAFTGAIVSDDLGATIAVSAIPPGTRAIDFLQAGGDWIIAKTAGATAAMVAAILARAQGDPAIGARVDDAARHVLQVKAGAGLLPC
ncbi:MAG TPA: glycoside hydrolase family 3 N-terminal domain-containing protein [Candidatus Limnocylindrales bacterium]|nr:glycoside hydrolase family 3 N-terminal domain-containing protein [Candidatus Limnocylindrales bacterium]